MAAPPSQFIVLRAFNELKKALILVRRDPVLHRSIYNFGSKGIWAHPVSAIAGVFTNGGAKPNIIPEEAALQYYVRAPKMAELLVLKEKIIKCFEGAAQATGCQVSFFVGRERLVLRCSNY